MPMEPKCKPPYDCEALCRPLRRELKVSKGDQEKFGAILFFVDGLLYVGWVPDVQFTYIPSVAYRCGLGFGDQITNINGHDVDGMRPADVHILIDQGRKLRISVSDAPLFRTITLPPVVNNANADQLGFLYSNSQIQYIGEGSLAEKVGLRVGDCIFEVDDESVFGVTDFLVVKAIQHARQTQHSEIRIKVMPTGKASLFLACFRQILKKKGMSEEPYMVLSHKHYHTLGKLGSICC